MIVWNENSTYDPTVSSRTSSVVLVTRTSHSSTSSSSGMKTVCSASMPLYSERKVV
ncbi:Uncharacterised protein [Mycobacteroides abscessus]|nr:Uncharacterised protein [Mycobacteroides abscessus]